MLCVAATSGIAGVAIGGMTYHHALGLGVRAGEESDRVAVNGKYSKQLRKLWVRVGLVINSPRRQHGETCVSAAVLRLSHESSVTHPKG